MEHGSHAVRKGVVSDIQYNDGEFAEVQTNGIEGIEDNLFLGTIQVHRDDTHDTKSEFENRFPVGMWLDIVTVTEISTRPTDSGETQKLN